MPENSKVQRFLSRYETAELVDAASELVDFELKSPEFGTAANASGIRSRELVFSRRLDSRTVFAADDRYGHLGRAGAWTGADRTAVAACRKFLRAAHIPAKEVADMEVMSEWGATSERLSEDEHRTTEPKLLRKIGRARRAIEGVPVWSSYATVGLTAEGRVGQAELHWPELASTVVREADLLAKLVEEGFEPPPLPGARPESTVAGILHSPAIGFFMDAVAALRVVYAGDDPTFGRKPTLHFDRHGDLVALPRDVEPTKQEGNARPVPEESSA